MSAATDSFVQQNRDRLLAELKEFIRIPSISTLPENSPISNGLPASSPAVCAPPGWRTWRSSPPPAIPWCMPIGCTRPASPRCCAMATTTCSPPIPWIFGSRPAFEPAERNGNLYARGAVDDKGQMYMHIKAIEALRAANGTLPLNVKFLIEGEEEVGGAAIARYVAENAEKLRADVVLVSDTAMYAEGMPTLCIGLRGLIYMEVEARGPARDLHSGLYGGAAPNAVYGLIQLLAKAKDADGALLIPGIYDNVDEPAPAERESWSRLPFRRKRISFKRGGRHGVDRGTGADRAGARLVPAHVRSARDCRRLHRRRSRRP